MKPIIDLTIDAEMPRARLGLLLKQFAELDDDREPWGSCIHSRRFCFW